MIDTNHNTKYFKVWTLFDNGTSGSLQTFDTYHDALGHAQKLERTNKHRDVHSRIYAVRPSRVYPDKFRDIWLESLHSPAPQ